MGCRVEIRTRAYLTASQCAPSWATLHPASRIRNPDSEVNKSTGSRFRNTALDRRELILSVLQVGDVDESTERPERRRGAGGTEGQEKWRQLQIQLRFGILLISQLSHHSVPRILSHSNSVDSGLVTAVNITYLFSLLLRIKLLTVSPVSELYCYLDLPTPALWR